MIRLAIILLALGAAWLTAAPAARADTPADFALGANTENQACRAVARFDAPRGARSADIYCGAWERPSGRVTAFADAASARAALAETCKGDATKLQSGDFTDLSQIACGRAENSAIRRYALTARRGGAVVVGEVYPSDWGPLVAAARVLTGAARPAAITAGSGVTPGLSQIEAVYPAGPPGQGAALNYELLRRRAYEYNAAWEFGASLRDYQDLLAAQKKVAPDDQAGEAEILAEIGLDLSSARRFDEARSTLDRAEALARRADDSLLVSKITNYRALDQLNQRHFNAALRLALAANAERAPAGRASGATAISASDVGRVESQSAALSQRTLLVSLGEASAADRSAVLTAQADYVAGVAARAMGQLQAAGDDLRSASQSLADAGTPPARLVGDISNARAGLDLAAGDYAGAEVVTEAGLASIRTIAPGTRGEAHLWLTLEAAQVGLGRTADALASGRAAMAIYARQTELPGLPPEIAAQHLALIESEWRRAGDPALAAEYFQTLSLVWDGSAARTTALLAARLALRDAGAQARAYQDAERAYRAAYARRQTLVADPDLPPAQLATATAAVTKAAADFGVAETDLRRQAPAYLELLSPLANATDLQGVLGDKEAYLRLVMTSTGGFGALVDKTGIHPFRTALTDAQADALVDKLRRTTHLHGRRLPDYDVASAEALYQGLIGPVNDRLASVRDLDVDVSGSLASIPFSALVATAPSPDTLDKISNQQDYSAVDWLARHFTVVNSLGPASFVRLRKETPPAAGNLTAVAFGDFQPDPALVADRVAAAEELPDSCRAEMRHSLSLLPPLPETADEAKTVAADFSNSEVVLGKDFTDVKFAHDPATANADVILLATHGVLAISPCFPEPALLTSVGDKGDGLIEASALLDRQLKARLVILSACDTAAGGKLDAARTGLDDGGDALSGLARGFIYAGARNVLASEWMVDSDSSKIEIGVLLAETSRDGKSAREAMSDAEAKVYSQAETGHPFYWAPFILVGEGGGYLAAAKAPDAR
jgi:CHAT domain-containing protein